jgi:hypothetical protein
MYFNTGTKMPGDFGRLLGVGGCPQIDRNVQQISSTVATRGKDASIADGHFFSSRMSDGKT